MQYKFDNVMLDIETVDIALTANIISIGAVRFDKSCPELQQQTYMVLDLKDGESYGLTQSPETLAWWDKQKPAAREVFACINPLPLHYALDTLNQFIAEVPNTKVWGNSASFDNLIIRNAFKTAEIKPSWSYRNDMCFRTMLRQFWTERVNFGIPHNALDDAKSQALTLIKIWDLIKLVKHPKVWGVE